MGVWIRPDEEDFFDVQPPPYSDHWHDNHVVTILEPMAKKGKPTAFLGRETDPPINSSEYPAFLSLSPHYDPELQQRRSKARSEKDAAVLSPKPTSTSTCHRRVRTQTTDLIPHIRQDFWLRTLRLKHTRKHKKASSSADASTSHPKFIAMPICLDPPKIINKITLSQDAIILLDPIEHSNFTITLATTLMEDRPYTICSTVLRRSQNQSLESALSHFEVVDLETGYALSGKPLPVHQLSDTNGAQSRKCSNTHRATIMKATCTELQPYSTSLITVVSKSSPFRSSTERLFDGLRISDPTLLVGRRLWLRLRQSVALWSVRTMGEVFGFGEEVVSWPDPYERPLALGCDDGTGDAAMGAEFTVRESAGKR